jgi:hypothetical protein
LLLLAVARRLIGGFDLLHRDLGEFSAIRAVRDQRHHEALIPQAHRPIERSAVARPFLERFAIGLNRLFELGRPALSVTK